MTVKLCILRAFNYVQEVGMVSGDHFFLKVRWSLKYNSQSYSVNRIKLE